MEERARRPAHGFERLFPREARDVDEPHHRLDTGRAPNREDEPSKGGLPHPRPERGERLGDADEMLYVLDGEILVDFGGKRHTVGQGGVVVAPRGVDHAFLVTSETARLLLVVTPGSAESFYFEVSEPAAERHLGGDGPVDFGRIRESAQKTGVTEILGPPPA